MKIYIVEDAPERMEWFEEVFADCEITHTDQVEQACNDIEENEYDIIFLDRDLGHPKLNGEDIAWHMMENELAQDAAIVIHSVNPRGQRNMKKYLDKYHPQVLQIPFTQLRKMGREDFRLN
jgi:DNA-binding LytR/AlgR family response regulator